eukprot:552194-Pleurochrysis_carterae.AAC.7
MNILSIRARTLFSCTLSLTSVEAAILHTYLTRLPRKPAIIGHCAGVGSQLIDARGGQTGFVEGVRETLALVTSEARTATSMPIFQTRGLHVRKGLTWSRTAIGAVMWPSGLTAQRRSATLANAAIPCVRMARPFVARAHAILKELVYIAVM